MSERTGETYLGDGLYAKDDGFMIWLRAPQYGGEDHAVALENDVLREFFRFVEESRGLKIKITRAEVQDEHEEGGVGA